MRQIAPARRSGPTDLRACDVVVVCHRLIRNGYSARQDPTNIGIKSWGFRPLFACLGPETLRPAGNVSHSGNSWHAVCETAIGQPTAASGFGT